MRILFLISSLGTGGAERVASLLCGHWAAMGHHVTLMPTYVGSDLAIEYTLDDGVDLQTLRARMRDLPPPLKSWPFRLREIHREIKAEKYDVVCSFLVNVNIAAILAAIGTGVPVVVSERSFPPAAPTPKALKVARLVTYPLASAIVAQTERAAEWLASNIAGIDPQVIANPVVLPLKNGSRSVMPEALISSERKVLLAVGRLHALKRFDWLISCFGDIADQYPEWDLVILGEGDQAGELQDLIEDRELRDRAYLPGRVDNLDTWYRRAQAFCLTSIYEGYPNALLEALAYGIPALAVDCDAGPREMIEEGRNGLLLPASSGDQDLRDGLKKLFAGIEVDQKQKAAFLNNHGIVKISSLWLDLFRRVVLAKRS